MTKTKHKPGADFDELTTAEAMTDRLWCRSCHVFFGQTDTVRDYLHVTCGTPAWFGSATDLLMSACKAAREQIAIHNPLAADKFLRDAISEAGLMSDIEVDG